MLDMLVAACSDCAVVKPVVCSAATHIITDTVLHWPPVMPVAARAACSRARPGADSRAAPARRSTYTHERAYAGRDSHFSVCALEPHNAARVDPTAPWTRPAPPPPRHRPPPMDLGRTSARTHGGHRTSFPGTADGAGNGTAVTCVRRVVVVCGSVGEQSIRARVIVAGWAVVGCALHPLRRRGARRSAARQCAAAGPSWRRT